MTKKHKKPILETAILEMGRLKKYHPFNPLEVIQWIYPQDWVHFIPELTAEVERLYQEEKIIFVTSEVLIFPLELQGCPILINIKL